jgi:hypothetical protein
VTAFAEAGLHRLWRRLALPVDPIAAGEALVGLPPANARQLLAVALATSPEADELVDGLSGLLRSLAVATAARPVRCEGEIRGPVLWSATMAARAASPGAGGVFICSSPVKAYDTDENQVLVAALQRLFRAAMAAEVQIEGDPRPAEADLRRARHNGEKVRRAMEHRSLQAVSRVRPHGRQLQKARTGTKAGVLRTAVALLQRSWAEVGADDLTPFLDDRTRTEHDLAASVLDTLYERGRLTERLRIVDGSLLGGPFAYRHLGSHAVTELGEPAGIHVDGRPVRSVDDLG